MTIFDRWGNLIYSCNDITKPWDGKTKSSWVVVQEDVYVINVSDAKGKKYNFRGIVTMVR